MTRWIVLSALVIFLASACGAPPNGGADGIEEMISADDPPSAAAAPAEEKKATPKQDKQAAQAEKFCAHEIEKSQSAPGDSLNRKQIQACLVALRPQIAKDCDKGVKRDITLKIIITKEGAVTGAIAIGDNADSAEAQCIVEKVKATSFPAFTGKETQEVEKYPFPIGQ